MCIFANLIRKLQIKLGFYFINKSNLTFNAKKKLIESTFLTVLDYGDILYMHASSILTSRESGIYHASLHFISSLSLYSSLSLFWQLPATLFQVFAFERTLSLYRTGKTAFSNAPWAWNNLQIDLKLYKYVSICECKSIYWKLVIVFGIFL